MATFTLTQEQYEALIAYARAGVTTDSESLVLDSFLKSIEKASGITRSLVWVQWQEQDQPLPPTTSFPAVWPPELRFRLELVSRPVAKVDVTKMLSTHARKPVSVLCTRDPAGLVGWTKLEEFFTQ
jgi:hypothetical protein